MKILRSLRSRLAASYIALALLLLLVTGYVFSNAISVYAVSVQSEQMAAYVKQATRLLEDAENRDLSREETLTFLRQNLPDVRVEMMPIAPDKQKQMEEALKAKKISLPSEKNVLIYSLKKPVESSFALPMVREYSVFYRFTLPSSAMMVLYSMYRQVLIVLIIAFALAGLIGWLLSRWLARPLSRLAVAAESVAEGNFREKVDQTGIIELDRLANQFNSMVLRLKELFQALTVERDAAQRFAADAAHELKTPVTTLRAYCEMASEHPERVSQILPAFSRQIRRMEQIISGLLQLASLSGGVGAVVQPTDICAQVRALEPGYKALAEESGLKLSVNCPDASIPVMLDQHLLEIALNNLIDNACKYTPIGGEITVTIQAKESEAVIAVKDTGKGISPEELPYIFERFHRGIDTQSIPGTGLGLAIAREAVLRMGGTITADSDIGKGTIFIISLPRQN